MEVGDKVTYYTHQSNEGEDRTKDELAFVTGVPNEKELDLVIFPVGGPLRYERAKMYDPEDIYKVPGGAYVREFGSEPPNFEEDFKYANDPRWNALLARQRAEHEIVQGPAAEQAMHDRHVQEQTELAQKIDEEMGGPPPPQAA